MGNTELVAFIKILEPLVRELAAVGLPGLLVMLFSGPAIFIFLVVIMSQTSARRMEKAYGDFRESMVVMLESYRSDTQNILREIGTKHAQVSEFYQKNVELVKNYERMTDALQTLVVNNTRTMEHLSIIIETRFKL